MRRLILIALLVAAVIGVIAVYFTYNKPHKDIAASDIDHQLSLSALIDEFEADPEAANLKYTEKVVAISATMNDMSDGEFTSLLLSDENGRMANCQMSEFDAAIFESGKSISLKGLFVGYDDLLGEVQLKKCTVLE